jgi:hypothetical protein
MTGLDLRFGVSRQALDALEEAIPLIRALWSGASRIADGWAAPIPSYLPYEKWAGAQAAIDDSARDAGRDPSRITRIAQLVGTLTEEPGPEWELTGEDPIRARADQWAAILAQLARELRFDSFIFWPERASVEQIERFAEQVVPRTRQLVAE